MQPRAYHLHGTLASGARQLVVQLALETMFIPDLYDSWFTPITNMGASADGAEMTTFLAPPWKSKPTCQDVGRTADFQQHYVSAFREYQILKIFDKVANTTLKWASALAVVVKTPVDSTIKSAPADPHGISEGSLWVLKGQ